MVSVNPYLNFDGNCGEVFDFYKSVFGGEFQTRMKFSDMPIGQPLSESDANRIMHVALPIGGSSVLMGSDRQTTMSGVKGTNDWISLQSDDKEEADKLFNGLSAGGSIMMPMAEVPWGAYFGMFVDKYGTQWMINCQKAPAA